MKNAKINLQLRYGLISLMAMAVLLGLIGLAPFIGPKSLALNQIFNGTMSMADNPDALIFFKLLLPRVLLAALTGASLALARVVLQALLKNPLATPYTIG